MSESSLITVSFQALGPACVRVWQRPCLGIVSPHQHKLPWVEWYRDSKLFVSSNMHTFVSVPVAEFESFFLNVTCLAHSCSSLWHNTSLWPSWSPNVWVVLHYTSWLSYNLTQHPGDRVRFHRFQAQSHTIDALQMPVASSRLQGYPQLLPDLATNCRFQWPFFFLRSD